MPKTSEQGEYVDDLLTDWGRWFEAHAKAYGWSVADVMDFDRLRLRRDEGTHSDPVSMEVSIRSGDSRMLAVDRTIRDYLSKPQRIIVIQRYGYGRTLIEIARDNSRSPIYNACNALLFRAKEAVSKWFPIESQAGKWGT